MNDWKARFVLFSILFLSGMTPLFSFQMEKQAKVRAPELSGGRSWLNTEKPLSLAALKGKIVLLDFWTYGCINCIHIIPDLKKLEAKYPNNLVVIGVHSAKFDNEKDTENIRKIILRYEVEHPVVNDADFKIWEQYAVRAYPTQVMIDPNGYIVTKQMCSVRDNWKDYAKTGAEVVGISTDSVDSHKGFSEKYDLPLTLLSDDGGKVSQMYEANSWIPGRSARAVVVVDKTGRISHHQVQSLSLFRPKDDEILEAIRKAEEN